MASVAVVGGGIAGTLCSLVLKNRGLSPVLIDAGWKGVGGRLRGPGCQFLRATDPRLAPVMDFLQGTGLVRPWRGRFGLLGSSGGGFLPAEVVTAGVGGAGSGGGSVLGLRPASDADPTGAADADSTSPPASDGGDFCQFVHASRSGITYAGAAPAMEDLCPRLVREAGIDSVLGTRVMAGSMDETGWTLRLQSQLRDPLTEPRSGHPSSSSSTAPDGMVERHFDGVVVATHDPSLAASFVDSIVRAEVDAGPYGSLDEALASSKDAEDSSLALLRRLSALSGHLARVRQEGRQPLYAIQATYPKGTFSHRLPFDAVSIPGSRTLQFFAREASKPGHDSVDDSGSGGNEGEVWTGISTTQLAKHVLAQDGWSETDQTEEAKRILMEEIGQLVGRYFVDDGGGGRGGGGLPEAADVRVRRWGAALCGGPGLGLKEDSVTLAGWRLGICGDFVRAAAYPSPWEAAALSGVEAGERMASLFITS